MLALEALFEADEIGPPILLQSIEDGLRRSYRRRLASQLRGPRAVLHHTSRR
jgi:hypothetical protein